MSPSTRRGRGLPVWLVVLCIATVLLQVAPLRSQTAAQATVTIDGYEAAAREVLVQFANIPAAARHQLLAQQSDSDENEPVGRRGLRRFRSRNFDVETLLAFFRAQGDVAFAEPNYIVRAVATPNDPQFPNLWGLLNIGQFGGIPGADIHATEAWDVSTGSRANVVAVIDTGIAYNHPDLAANVWSAPAPFTVTIGTDTFTCPAGSHGFNAIPKPRTFASCNPMDDHNHGTHVSGTIGGVGNNGVGVTGVSWTASIIGGKFLNASGAGNTADAIDTIDFMIQAKAALVATGGANIRVLNNSWGGGGFSIALQNAIADAQANDMLFVAAAGNSGSNNDIYPFYPASYAVPNVVAVAATTSQDLRASFSNYGATSVALAAPGENILSTTIGGAYGYSSGTSMATPHVSGAAALVLSACALNTAALKSTLLTTVDVLGSLTGLVATNGRLNLDRAIRTCGTATIPPPPTGLTAIPDVGQLTLLWSASAGATSYNVKRSTTSGGPYTTIATGVGTTSYIDSGFNSLSAYYYVVSAMNAVGESADSAEASAAPLAGVPPPPQNLDASPGDARVSLIWLPSPGADKYRVKRSLVRSGPYVLVTEVTGTAFTDLSVTNGTKYYYTVSAANEAGESKDSNRTSAIPGPIPAPPTGVSAVTGSNVGEIDLSWNPSSWATTYKIKRSGTSGGPYTWSKKVTTLSFTASGLTSGKRYYYLVSALNATGESGPSLEVSAIAK